MSLNVSTKFEDAIKSEDAIWINKFLTGSSSISPQDSSIQALAQSILTCETLKDLVKARYQSGIYFLGWAENGSKGFTEVDTGNIWIKKTGLGTEPFTLGYECINSKNRIIYKKIGIKYAVESTTPENRKKFAREILGVEAQAMYVKCKLATELGKRELIKDYYLDIYDNDSLEESEKITKLTETMIEKGVVHGGKKSAYNFYQNERYDEFIGFYREEFKKGKIN